MKKRSVFQLALSALFSAVIVVCAWVSVPLPSGVFLTLQTFGMALGGYLLGAFRGSAAWAVYLAIGTAGFPAFSGFTGGIGQLLGLSGGFLFGFLPLVLLCGIAKRFPEIRLRWLLGLGGLAGLHFCGTLQVSFVSGNGFLASAVIASLPYLLKDILSVIAAEQIARRLLRRPEIRNYFE